MSVPRPRGLALLVTVFSLLLLTSAAAGLPVPNLPPQEPEPATTPASPDLSHLQWRNIGPGGVGGVRVQRGLEDRQRRYPLGACIREREPHRRRRHRRGSLESQYRLDRHR